MITVGLGGGIRGLRDAQPLGLGRRPLLLVSGRPTGRRTRRSPQVEGVGVALRAVTEDGDLLPLEGRRSGVGVVVHAGRSIAGFFLR